jgi:hypothetical protein
MEHTRKGVNHNNVKNTVKPLAGCRPKQSIRTDPSAANMKMAVFWDVALRVWYKFTDVSEVLTASVVALMLHL